MLEHIGVEGLDILALQEARDQVLKFLIYLYNQAYTYMTVDITGTHTSQINTKHIFVADSAARLPYSLSLFVLDMQDEGSLLKTATMQTRLLKRPRDIK